jgi:uncharacterized membrane protein
VLAAQAYQLSFPVRNVPLVQFVPPALAALALFAAVWRAVRVGRGAGFLAYLAVWVVGVLALALAWGGGVLFSSALVVLAFALLFCTIAVGASYETVYSDLPRRLGWLLVGMRVVAILLLLSVLLLFPELAPQEAAEDHRPKPHVALLIDTSESMSMRDYPNTPPRLGRALEQITQHRDVLEGRFVPHLYRFDARAHKLADFEALPALRPTGKSTDLSRSALEVRTDLGRADVAAVVLITDGQHNGPTNPLRTLARYGPPLYALGVGSDFDQERRRGDFKDIAVEAVDCPETTVVNHVCPVKVTLSASGYPNRKVQVTLAEEGKPPVSENVVLLAGRNRHPVELRFTPTKVGRAVVHVAVPVEPSERVTENNRQTAYVQVTDPKIRVLLIEGTVRSEFKFLRRALETDPNVQVLSLVRIAGNRFLRLGTIKDVPLTAFPATPAEIEQFDVFIVGDLHRSFLSDTQMGALQTAVEDKGKGFLMIGGQNSFAGGLYGGTPVARILPVQLGASQIGREPGRFTLRLTPAGARHEIFKGTGAFFTAASDVKPELTGCSRVAAAKQVAEALAVHPTAKVDGKPLVVLAAARIGAGRTAAFTADTTWRWYLPLRGLGRESPYLKFWGQTVRWLANKQTTEKREGPGVDVMTRKALYDQGETVRLQARVRDEEGRATNFAAVTADCLLDGKLLRTVALTRPEGPKAEVGLYGTELVGLDSGDYALTVVAEKGGKELARGEIGFKIGKPNLEFERPSLNEKLLRGLTPRYYGLTDFGELLSAAWGAHRQAGGPPPAPPQTRHPLGAMPRFVSVPDEQAGGFKTVLDAGTRWIFDLALFSAAIGLMTAEWLLRRRHHLR